MSTFARNWTLCNISSSSIMPPKRKNDGNEEGDVEPTGREKKKQKMAVARTIAVQSTPSVTFALPQNAEAGPSRLPIDSELV